MRASLSPRALHAVLAGSLAAAAPLSLAINPAALAFSPLETIRAPAESLVAQLDLAIPEPYSRIRAVNLALGQALPAPGMDPARFAALVQATPLGRSCTPAIAPFQQRRAR